MGTTRSFRALATLLALTLLEACATIPAQDRNAAQYGSQTSRAMITAQQLQSANATTTQDALRRLRPLLFTQRVDFAVRDPYRGYAVLYVDGQLQGSLELLNTIPLNAVRAVQFLSASEAYAFFGRFHPGGVVEVNIRR